MYDCVRDLFPSFSKEFEGRVPFMYLDIRGLVTVGVGNLIDPVSQALELPFVHEGTGAAASRAEIETEWQLLKGQLQLAHQGHRACESITRLRLTEFAIDELVIARLHSNEVLLRKRFTEWDSWPADAQLGVLSMAWALGPGFPSKWPKFTAAVKTKDFDGAAAHCRMHEADSLGVKPRNDADQLLFANAAAVERQNLDRTELHYRNPMPSRVES